MIYRIFSCDFFKKIWEDKSGFADIFPNLFKISFDWSLHKKWEDSSFYLPKSF